VALNAAEAIGSGGGTITVRTGVLEVDAGYTKRHPGAADLTPGKYVFLEVRDTGCGMDASTRAKIFDPFFTTKFMGRGLGLAAVAGIVRGHKGAIEVVSTLAEGSCFTVLFPASGRQVESPAPARTVAPRGAGTVLVVDDEHVVRELARRALELHGYSVLVAEDGRAANRRVEKTFRPDRVGGARFEHAAYERGGIAASAEEGPPGRESCGVQRLQRIRGAGAVSGSAGFRVYSKAIHLEEHC
jgi:hypothetical protein